ncbi:MAG: Hsp20/alpha crystallin family protein [bacterium]|nr:Hsp20/alpha crystallin family protein [bacterium]
MVEKQKKSFFERLTGVINMDHLNDETEKNPKEGDGKGTNSSLLEEDNSVGQLTVDVSQTADSIVIKAMVAGVKPEDLDVSITRDMVTIRGKRTEDSTVTESDYFLKELYWGEFARTIVLPAEIEADEAEAQERHGLLIIKLPKLDKHKQTRLRVKAI